MRDQGIEDLKWRRRTEVRAAAWAILDAVDQRVVWPVRNERLRMRDQRRGVSFQQPRDQFVQDLYDAIKDMCAALGVTTE